MFAQKWNAIFTTIGEAARTFKWSDFGKNLAGGLNTAIADFDWSGNGARIGDLAKGLLDTISTFLEQTDWRKLGESIKTFVVSIDWTGIVSALARGFGAAVGALGALIGGLIGDAIKDAKKYFNKKAEECGGSLWKGVLKGILDAIVNIAVWIKKTIHS